MKVIPIIARSFGRRSSSWMLRQAATGSRSNPVDEVGEYKDKNNRFNWSLTPLLVDAVRNLTNFD